MTAATIREHLQYMRDAGQLEYADAARVWYWNLLGQYLKGN